MARDPNRRPTHPGELLREDVLPELQISQGELANRLGVSRLTVSALVNEHRAMTAEMAVRFEELLGVSAEMLLGMQQAVDLWDARSHRARGKTPVTASLIGIASTASGPSPIGIRAEAMGAELVGGNFRYFFPIAPTFSGEVFTPLVSSANTMAQTIDEQILFNAGVANAESVVYVQLADIGVATLNVGDETSFINGATNTPTMDWDALSPQSTHTIQ